MRRRRSRWPPTMADIFASLKGRPVVLYFYPRNDTPGCTTEAKDFSCLIGDFKKAGAAVIGISPDDPKCHNKLRKKVALAVEPASDIDKMAGSPGGRGWQR